MSKIEIPIPAGQLPAGWHIFNNNRTLGMLGANASILEAPRSEYRLRGPEWQIVLTWRVPQQVAPGVAVYDETQEVIAEVSGVGFWGALREALTDWCGAMPDELRERLLSEVGPRADAEWLASQKETT